MNGEESLHRSGDQGSPLEIWGGVECTVRRVGNDYDDQIRLSGHEHRDDDLARFAALGIQALRFPVLWERVAPDGLAQADWTWPDRRLSLLQHLGVRPIVGLLHHGSGPSETSLVDPDFPQKLADYALAVAQRYPWLRQFTPVNEPLTTARFSGLYGHWYPHGRDDETFARALIQQCRGTVLAMQAIRSVIPQAELVQTEDLAKTHSTPPLADQAEFDNARRWGTFDLLCGRLDGSTRLGRFLLNSGIQQWELDWFQENRCVPELLGLNYYVTSERFLDERLQDYPAGCHGGNGRQRYADVEAVRVCGDGLDGHEVLMREAWTRYQLPLALTEVHLGCHRESQLRWLAEAWHAAQRLRREGVDVRAITAWSLLGAFDWDSLLTQDRRHYESGLFDLRGPGPRATALCRMVSEMAAGRQPRHPVLDEPGWWRRPARLLYRPGRVVEPDGQESPHSASESARALLIVGARGTLGQAFARICAERGLHHQLLGRQDIDIADPASVAAALTRLNPWAVINAAGYVRVDEAERDRRRCYRENSIGPTVLAQACARRGLHLVSFSSDLVFDGQGRRPYVESDATAPLSCYGHSKTLAEAGVLQAHPATLIVRSSAFFGPWDVHNFLTLALRQLSAGGEFRAASDVRVSPTYVPDLVNACLDLLIDGASGIWHIANPGSPTWFEFARLAAEAAGVDPRRLRGQSQHELGHAARRPQYSVLGSERGLLLPPLHDAIGRYLHSNPCGLAPPDGLANDDARSWLM